MKKLLVLTILLISANCFSQGFKTVAATITFTQKTVSLSVTDMNLKGNYEMLVITLKNLSATKYDTCVFRHINDKGDTTFPMFRKLRPNSYPVVWGADTLKDTIVVAPLTTVDVLLWKPFPFIVEVKALNVGITAADTLRQLKLSGTYSRKY